MPRGGYRPGAGAPRGNANALKKGQRSHVMLALVRCLLEHPGFRPYILALLRKRSKGLPPESFCGRSPCPFRIAVPSPPRPPRPPLGTRRSLALVRALGLDPGLFPILAGYARKPRVRPPSVGHALAGSGPSASGHEQSKKTPSPDS